ncbi:FAD-binding oxidoreductase [Aquitalea sp. ASV11]|uniref:NAD(P)/FAD-dependent oxidoreductase n=1 Tax=Aquitalea sp. ASV11 TaxID=2795103 RepID=UPI0018EB522D|nr:FAD-binding oxidoreductase [Aquitalea sp. ASV11]
MKREHAPHLSQFDGHHVNSWYAASAPLRERYPVLGEVVRCDVCVVGAGLTGLSAALTLVEKGLSVAVLEGALVGFGASGRNGGQILHGFAAPFRVFEQQLGTRAARQCWEASLDGLALIANRIHQHHIDCDLRWGFLTTASNRHQHQQLRKQLSTLHSCGYHDAQWLEGKELAEQINSPVYTAALHDSGCGHLHPLKYAQGLARAASRAGVRLFEHSPVTSIDEDRLGLQIGTPGGWIRADKMVLACNVDIGALQPQLRRAILPVESHILATAPLTAEHAASLLPEGAAVCSSDKLLDYFRLTPDHRLLFGGRTSRPYAQRQALIADRHARMVSIFPSLNNSPIDYAWSGHVDIGPARLPQIGRQGQRVYHAQGFAGHGLAFTGVAGQMIAEAIAGDLGRFDIFNKLYAHPLPLPASMEESLIRLGSLYYRLRDALGF